MAGLYLLYRSEISKIGYDGRRTGRSDARKVSEDEICGGGVPEMLSEILGAESSARGGERIGGLSG